MFGYYLQEEGVMYIGNNGQSTRNREPVKDRSINNDST